MRNITLFNLCEISNSILVRTQFGQGVAKKKKKNVSFPQIHCSQIFFL